MRWTFLCVAFVDSEPALAASDPTPAMVAAWLATRGHSGLTYGPPEVRAQPGALREYSPPKRVDTCASPDEPKVTSGTNIQWGATILLLCAYDARKV